MAVFDKFFEFLQRSEQGYQNHPGDTGNLNSRGIAVGTNHGLSAKVYEQYLGRVPTEQDMRQMSRTTAREVIHQVYWNQMVHGDQIKSQMVANAIGDVAVTSEKAGISLANQRLLLSGYPVAAHNQHTELRPDEIGALNSMKPQQEALFLNAFAADQRGYYAGLDESHDAFKHGWDNRVVHNFPETPAEGWEQVKEQDYYLTTKAIQHVLWHGAPHQVDGHFGEHTQAELQEYQRLHELPPTGHLDEATRGVLLQDIMADDTTRSWGEREQQDSANRDRHALSATPHVPTAQDHSWASPDSFYAPEQQALTDQSADLGKVPEVLVSPDQSWSSDNLVADVGAEQQVSDQQVSAGAADQQVSTGISDSMS